jgi:hypothetical protein
MATNPTLARAQMHTLQRFLSMVPFSREHCVTRAMIRMADAVSETSTAEILDLRRVIQLADAVVRWMFQAPAPQALSDARSKPEVPTTVMVFIPDGVLSVFLTDAPSPAWTR